MKRDDLCERRGDGVFTAAARGAKPLEFSGILAQCLAGRVRLIRVVQ